MEINEQECTELVKTALSECGLHGHYNGDFKVQRVIDEGDLKMLDGYINYRSTLENGYEYRGFFGLKDSFTEQPDKELDFRLKKMRFEFEGSIPVKINLTSNEIIIDFDSTINTTHTYQLSDEHAKGMNIELLGETPEYLNNRKINALKSALADAVGQRVETLSTFEFEIIELEPVQLPDIYGLGKQVIKFS